MHSTFENLLTSNHVGCTTSYLHLNSETLDITNSQAKVFKFGNVSLHQSTPEIATKVHVFEVSYHHHMWLRDSFTDMHGVALFCTFIPVLSSLLLLHFSTNIKRCVVACL